jgi:cytochrome c-type biogenesis protein CcmH/NrfF
MEGYDLAAFGEWLVQVFLLYWVLPIAVLAGIAVLALRAYRRREEQAAAERRRLPRGSQRSGPT